MHLTFNQVYMGSTPILRRWVCGVIGSMTVSKTVDYGSSPYIPAQVHTFLFNRIGVSALSLVGNGKKQRT